MSKKTPEEGTRFSEFLTDHNGGQSERLASEALRRLGEAVRETGKKGTVTLKVSVDPMKNAEGMVLTTVDVVEKLPVLPLKASVFYTDDEGNLLRRDPRQQVLFDDSEVKDAPDAPAAAADEVKDLVAKGAEVRDIRATGGAR